MSTTFKQITLNIPNTYLLPEQLFTFIPDENYLMLKIGCDAVLESKKIITMSSTKDIREKVENDFKLIIEELNKKIELEIESSNKIQEKTTKMYETQIELLNSKLEKTSSQLNSYNFDKNNQINDEINRLRDKYDTIYHEKEKQVDKISNAYEKLLLTITSKSTSSKGTDGEKLFETYASTFIDFKGFKLIDKHTQGGEGDFHIQFDEFNVLVDAKNYKKKVPIEQREKIKNDLIKNEHINFGWLVSLNTSIDKYDRSPIMYEWINSSQCLVYVNNLNSFEDPSKILRIIWFTCKELFKLIKDENITIDKEFIKIQDKHFTVLDKIKCLRKNVREINTSINTTKNLMQSLDIQLRDILDSETTAIVESSFTAFDDWWENNIIQTNDNSIKISTTDLWLKFKHDNKSIIKEFDLNPDKFKQYIKSKIPLSSIMLKNKNANSAFDIIAITIKPTILNQPQKIDVELNE